MIRTLPETDLYHIFLRWHTPVRPFVGGEVQLSEAAHADGFAQDPLLFDCVSEDLSSASCPQILDNIKVGGVCSI